MTMRRTAASLLAAAITSTTFLAVAAPGAEAAPVDARAKACVTKAEYKKAKKGMPMAKVHKIFGTSGKQTVKYPFPEGGNIIGRAYKVCTSKKGAVGISYIAKPGKKPVLAEKVVAWR